MNPSRIFILRPVATTLLMIAILLVGIIAYLQLPLSALPEVAYPTIQVQTFYPGASPEVITSAITAPLEKQFGQMPGLNQMSSTQLGRRLGHHAAVRPDSADRRRRAGSAGGHQRRAEPAAAGPAGAADLRQGQSGRCAGADSGHHLQGHAADRGRGPGRHAHRAEDLAIEGVGVVSISGGQRPAVRVIVNPRALAAYGLNLDDLRTTINVANQNGPKGTLDGPTRAYTINTNDQISSAEEYGKIVVAYETARRCGCRTSPRWCESAENTKLGGWMNTHARADHQRPAPAGRQRRRRGQPHQDAAARRCRPRCPPASIFRC